MAWGEGWITRVVLTFQTFAQEMPRRRRPVRRGKSAPPAGPFHQLVVSYDALRLAVNFPAHASVLLPSGRSLQCHCPRLPPLHWLTHLYPHHSSMQWALSPMYFRANKVLFITFFFPKKDLLLTTHIEISLFQNRAPKSRTAWQMSPAMGAAMIGPIFSLRENGAQHGGRFHLRFSAFQGSISKEFL